VSTNYSSHINLPKFYAKTAKRNNRAVRLLAFAVLIKFEFGNSAFHPTAYNVKTMFHCSHKSALRLIEDAKQCPNLFYYHQKTNLLIARSFRASQVIKDNPTNNRRKSHSDYCIKIERPQEYSIAQMSIYIREQLALCAINAKQRTDDFHSPDTLSTRRERANALLQKRLAAIMGYKSASTANRHMTKLEQAGVIKVQHSKLRPVYDNRHDKALISEEHFSQVENRRLIQHGSISFVREANQYQLTSSETQRRFCHIIYDYDLRINQRKSNNKSHVVVENNSAKVNHSNSYWDAQFN
jgi:hypothetical protein